MMKEKGSYNIGWVILGIIMAISGFYQIFTTISDNHKTFKDKFKDISDKTSFKLNETFENDYLKITMIESNLDFKDYSEYFAPKDNYKYVMVKFEIQNINDDNSFISSLYFHGFADDVAVENAYISNDNYNDLSANIGKGKKTIGYIFYEIPINTTNFTIQYETSVLVDDSIIEFVVE